MIEAMLLLKAASLGSMRSQAADTLQLEVQALRYAWQNRLEQFGGTHSR